MILILMNQSAKLLYPTKPEDGIKILKDIEYAGRNCYASQDKITDDSYKKFIGNLLKRHHETPMEFGDIVFDITTSRAVLAELTRHRLCSFMVESQRYIQEAGTGDITFIIPQWAIESKLNINGNMISIMDTDDPSYTIWHKSMKNAERDYIDMINNCSKPEEAREVLPNSTACRIIMKANVREWRHIFELRTSPAAYPQMRALMKNMLDQISEIVPIVFDDIKENN